MASSKSKNAPDKIERREPKNTWDDQVKPRGNPDTPSPDPVETDKERAKRESREARPDAGTGEYVPTSEQIGAPDPDEEAKVAVPDDDNPTALVPKEDHDRAVEEDRKDNAELKREPAKDRDNDGRT